MRITVMDRNGQQHTSSGFESSLTPRDEAERLSRLKDRTVIIELASGAIRTICDPVWVDIEP